MKISAATVLRLLACPTHTDILVQLRRRFLASVTVIKGPGVTMKGHAHCWEMAQPSSVDTSLSHSVSRAVPASQLHLSFKRSHFEPMRILGTRDVPMALISLSWIV